MTVPLVDNTTVTLTGPVIDPVEQTNAVGAAWWMFTINDPTYGRVDVRIYPYMAEAARPLMVAGTRVRIVGRVDGYMAPEGFVIAQNVTAA